MIITLHSSSDLGTLRQQLGHLGLTYRFIELYGVALCLLDRNPDEEEISLLKRNTAVKEIIPQHKEYQLTSRLWKHESTSFDVNGQTIGSKHEINIIAGPCSVENEDQIFSIAESLHRNGVKFIRGGAYKPRTSPYRFQGLGLAGLKLIKRAADKYNLRVVTEVIDSSLIEEILPYADILQVGSRNMMNFHFLKELGKLDKPVLLKRGMAARIEEWLMAAEYILNGGNEKVILCERGIRTFDTAVRNTMDIASIPMVKQLSHLPVFADPSHGTGRRDLVKPLTLAAIAAGADGLLVEIHPDPDKALSDGAQSLTLEQFDI
nr:3-deoxy-7-phosphoheptulonate synthase [Bacteroidota bacterium]